MDHKNRYRLFKPQIIFLFLLIGLVSAQTAGPHPSQGQENRLFWDGGDWKRVGKLVDYNPKLEYTVKAAYVNGVLDGRLFYYLKTWAKQEGFADSLYAETVDYLDTRELVHSLDNFYEDPTQRFVPVPSAIIIANMQAERLPLKYIDEYTKQSKFWINELMYRMEIEGSADLLNEKVRKHLEKQPEK